MIKNEEQALEVDPFEGDYGDSTDAVLKTRSSRSGKNGRAVSAGG